MKKTGFASLLLSSALAAGPAAAADLGYSYGELYYQSVDAGASDGDGFALDGSFAVTDVLFVTGAYSSVDYDHGVSQDGWSAGAGVHLPVNAAADFIISAAFGNDEVKTRFGRADSDFYAAGVALRGRVAPAFELEGGLDYVDYDQGGDDTEWSLGALYELTPQVSLALRYRNTDNADALSLGGRYYF